MGITDPLGLQTPAQQVQAFFVAQVGRDLQHFKEVVVYYGFDYQVEVARLEEQFALWQAQLERTEHVDLRGLNIVVELTTELKRAIVAEAEGLKENYLECCKDPQLAQLIDNAVKIKLEDVNAAAEHRQMMDTHRPDLS